MERLLSPLSKQLFSPLIPSALLANRSAKPGKKIKQKGEKYIAGSGWPRPHRYSRAQMKTQAQAFYLSVGLKKKKKKSKKIWPEATVDCCTTYNMFTRLSQASA